MTLHDHDCTECPLVPARRTFFRNAAATVVAAFSLTAVSSDLARALATATLTSSMRGAEDPPTYAIPAKDGVQIDKDNGIIIVRSLGSVYAFALACPHQNTPLRYVEADDHFVCPKHKSQYAADGYFISGRATRGMDRYAIKRDGKNIVVDVKSLKKQDDDEKGWNAAVVTLKKDE